MLKRLRIYMFANPIKSIEDKAYWEREEEIMYNRMLVVLLVVLIVWTIIDKI